MWIWIQQVTWSTDPADNFPPLAFPSCTMRTFNFHPQYQVISTRMSSYNAEDIEVLTGLEPVRKRPGMYTDTSRPNHLAQEVIDNSVDEALAGHADQIDVVLFKDGSVSVSDNGRGMPVDIHPEQGKPGVEVILSTLHAGGKFSDKNYQFSGGLHGVGVSVVNALSCELVVTIRRDGSVHQITFAGGEKTSDLKVIDSCGKRNTGTTVKFTPDPGYFDSINFSVSRLVHVLRAKAVLLSLIHISEPTRPPLLSRMPSSA